MASITQTAGSLAQLTATNNTAEIATATKLGLVCSIKHVNGTGTITAGATIQPQIEHNTVWYNYGGAFTANTTASSTQIFTFVLDTAAMPASALRFAYTAPTGSTGHTLDTEYTTQDTIE